MQYTLELVSFYEHRVMITNYKLINDMSGNIQGVPRNMKIRRRLKSRLWYLNLFVTFSLLSTLTCMILETIIT